MTVDGGQPESKRKNNMLNTVLEKKEKKVEYIELIYDLIFVYMVGRNNSLLHNISNGFVMPGAFLAYILTTLAVIQIWNYSTYYINVYGRNRVRDHVFLFINMFLLYFMGEGTRMDWQAYQNQYIIAWALILINIGTQYLIERRNHKEEPTIRTITLRMAIILYAEAALVLTTLAETRLTGRTWMTLVAIGLSMTSVMIFGQRRSTGFVDFTHLSERAMLYVVFTFGEMIICIAGYFEGEFTLSSLYFALMGFLIVVGLFLSYGAFYDHIVDREMKTNGLLYIFIHVFIVLALNNITNALEFMQEEEVALVPKMVFLLVSFVLYFGLLFVLGSRFAKKRCRMNRLLIGRIGWISAVFVVLMLLIRNQTYVHIALTVVFVFVVFVILHRFGEKMDGLANAGAFD